MGGGDINPIGKLQIFYAGCGVVFASYINANIFAQLQLILAYVYKEDKQFQRKMAKVNGAMVGINLPDDTRNIIRSDLIRFAPLELGQRQMIYLIQEAPPSIRQKMVIHHYTKFLKSSFNMNDEATLAIAQNMEIDFYWPE